MSGQDMDAAQVLKAAFDEDNQAFRINVVTEDNLAMIGGFNMDAAQVLKQIFDSDNQALRVNIVEGGSGGDNANTALSNLVAPTAINADLLPGINNTISVGSAASAFAEINSIELNAIDDTSNFKAGLVSTVLVGDIVLTLPAITTTIAGLGIVQTFTAAQTYNEAVSFNEVVNLGAVARITDGSASSPSLALSNDGANTGLYRAAADSLGFTADGTSVGLYSATGAWRVGPTAGLGTTGAAYHSVIGNLVGNNSATVPYGTSNRGRASLLSNVFYDSAGTAKALAADQGYSYLTVDARTSAGGAAFTFNSNHANVQVANTALAGAVITTGVVSAAGSWTLGPDGNTVAHTVNGAISYPKINDTSTGTITALVSLNRNHIKLTASTTITLQGVVAGTEGQRITLINLTGNTMTLQNDTTATAANRIYTPGAVDLLVRNQGSVDLIYDTTAQRWFTGQI